MSRTTKSGLVCSISSKTSTPSFAIPTTLMSFELKNNQLKY